MYSSCSNFDSQTPITAGGSQLKCLESDNADEGGTGNRVLLVMATVPSLKNAKLSDGSPNRLLNWNLRNG